MLNRITDAMKNTYKPWGLAVPVPTAPITPKPGTPVPPKPTSPAKTTTTNPTTPTGGAKVRSLGAGGMCIEVEEEYCTQGRSPPGNWVHVGMGSFAGVSGCGMLKWTTRNRYAKNALVAADKVCFKLNVQQAGKYHLDLYGGRRSDGRTTIKCSHKDKAGSIAKCQATNNNTCVCNDLENDVWTIVSGVLASEGTGPEFTEKMVPLKAMLSCTWDKLCKKGKVNINHEFYSADYMLQTGP